MSGVKYLLVWITCVALGGAAGYAIGWALWKLDLELIGSAVALLFAGIGGFVALFAYLRWTETRRYR